MKPEQEKKHEETLEKPATIKGDAERKYQQERQEKDKTIKPGTKVKDFAYGKGIVRKVNKKSYTVEYESGYKHARDKIFIDKIPQDTKVDIKKTMDIKKGDKVEFSLIGRDKTGKVVSYGPNTAKVKDKEGLVFQVQRNNILKKI